MAIKSKAFDLARQVLGSNTARQVGKAVVRQATKEIAARAGLLPTPGPLDELARRKQSGPLPPRLKTDFGARGQDAQAARRAPEKSGYGMVGGFARFNPGAKADESAPTSALERFARGASGEPTASAAKDSPPPHADAGTDTGRRTPAGEAETSPSGEAAHCPQAGQEAPRRSGYGMVGGFARFNPGAKADESAPTSPLERFARGAPDAKREPAKAGAAPERPAASAAHGGAAGVSARQQRIHEIGLGLNAVSRNAADAALRQWNAGVTARKSAFAPAREQVPPQAVARPHGRPPAAQRPSDDGKQLLPPGAAARAAMGWDSKPPEPGSGGDRRPGNAPGEESNDAAGHRPRAAAGKASGPANRPSGPATAPPPVHAAALAALGLPADAGLHQLLGLTAPLDKSDIASKLDGLVREQQAALEAYRRGDSGAWDGVMGAINKLHELRTSTVDQIVTADARQAQIGQDYKNHAQWPEIRDALREAQAALDDVLEDALARMDETDERLKATADAATQAAYQAAGMTPVRSQAEIDALAHLKLPADASDHDILGVPPDADRAALSQARTRLLMAAHPDKNPGAEGAMGDVIKLVNDAYKRASKGMPSE